MGNHLCVICCFSLAAFNIYSLSFIFVSLINMFPGVFRLGFILFGTFLFSQTWVVIFLPILGKFSIIILSIFSCPLFLYSSSSFQSLSHVRLFVTPWITARQASLSITKSGVHSDSHPSIQWWHPAISSSVIPFSSCPQSLPASESFPMSQHFAWGAQSTGVSALASYLPKTPRTDLLQNGWAFFGIAFLWDWNKNWPFPVLWPLLSFLNLVAYWVQHFHSIIFQDLE